MWGAGLALALSAGHAQDRREQLEALERERTQQIREAQSRQAPQWSGARQAPWLEPVRAESPCFPIQRVQWLAPSAAPAALDVVLTDLGAFTDACLGADSIDRLRRNLEARLVALGYVTSSLSLPAQNRRRRHAASGAAPGAHCPHREPRRSAGCQPQCTGRACGGGVEPA
ncbi:POTRA domain-containing protein [Roseateles sp. LKC17W]|uniref:POTRA domain-containing protein n=1 Tax=Pelomonas margarita TaxID=3299031 RepID=A0ABW7FG54_9BURK